MEGEYELSKRLCGHHRRIGHIGEEMPVPGIEPKTIYPFSLVPISYWAVVVGICRICSSTINIKWCFTRKVVKFEIRIKKRSALEPKSSGSSAKRRSIVWWVLTHATPTPNPPTLRSRRLQLLITKHNQTTLNENGMLGEQPASLISQWRHWVRQFFDVSDTYC